MKLWCSPPPSANNLFFNGKKGRVKSAEYRAWIQVAGLQINQQRPTPVGGRVQVEYRIPRNNRRDLANFEKGLSDLLVTLKLIEDDRKIERLHMNWTDAGPHVLIEVWPA